VQYEGFNPEQTKVPSLDLLPRLQMGLPAKDVLAHIVDVHCHPTDNEVGVEDAASLPIRLCAMATRADDQAKVADLANKNPKRVNNMVTHSYGFDGTN
jgi:hypothetical protein